MKRVTPSADFFPAPIRTSDCTISSNPFAEFLKLYSIEQAGEEAPERFVREVLGCEPDKWQSDALRAYGRGERLMSIVSGHGVGKSTLMAWVAIHHILTRFPQKTVMTAPSSPQLFDVLYAETKAWVTRLPPPLRDLLEVKADRIELKSNPDASFITARTSRPDQPEAIAGIHAEHVLILGDEASGIPEKVFEAGAGSMSGHSATTLLAGNPVRSSGLFYDTHHKLKTKWWTLRVSCEDSPRVSNEFIEDMKVRYGEKSNAFRVRVLGLFPLADDDTVIGFDLVESARGREIMASPTTPIVWGLDVARFGNDANSLCKRKGPVVLVPNKTWRNADLMETCGRVKAEYDGTPPGERPVEILVDAIGLGAGVADRLRELKLPARAINVGEASALSERFQDLRSELWWAAREWLGTFGVRLPPDCEALAQELVVPKYAFTSSGKIKVESKDAMKKRGFDSPNEADAFVLTFASNATTAMYGIGPDSGKPLLRRIKGVE